MTLIPKIEPLQPDTGAPELDDLGKRRRDRERVGPPNGERGVLKDRDEAERDDQSVEMLAAGESECRALDDEGERGDGGHRPERRHREAGVVLRDEQVRDVAADHEHLAVGEVQDAHDPVRQREPERHGRVHRAGDQPMEEKPEEQLRHRRGRSG